jgi:hypothetical protein
MYIVQSIQKNTHPVFIAHKLSQHKKARLVFSAENHV